jgi:SAM-dependent methyltransferase
MILYSNLPAVVEAARAAKTALDVGGWFQPLNAATHVLDINPYQTRRADDALDPQNVERFTRETWVTRDACKAPWPFPDKFFDFSFCSHLLEDVRDPLIVCAELQRVSRSGYIETPSRLREIFSKERLFRLKTALGRFPSIGFPHHRWYVEIERNHVMFTVKDHRILKRREFFVTRSDLGRKLTEEESGVGLFWHGPFTFEEVPIHSDRDLSAFRQRALDGARRAASRRLPQR